MYYAIFKCFEYTENVKYIRREQNPDQYAEAKRRSETKRSLEDRNLRKTGEVQSKIDRRKRRFQTNFR